MTAFDEVWILKATRDEEAYNAFMRAYNDMMSGRDGLFDSVPDAVRGQESRYNVDDGEWRWLEDKDIHYNTITGEAYKSTYLEDEDEYHEEKIDIPTPVGAGLEGKVFRIPKTDYVAKIPMLNMNSDVRGMAEGAVDRVMRSPLEAYWSKVLSHQYPVNPYSVFTSKHPLDKNKPSLNLVQEYADEYHPKFQESEMNAIHEHLFGMKDVGVGWDDLAYDMETESQNFDEQKTQRTEQIRELAENYPLYEDTDMGGNVYGNIVLDYLSNTPFIEDEYGGLLQQEEIDKLVEAALYEQERLPKRYRKFGSNIDNRIQTIIDELLESQKEGRLLGSSIDFADDRLDVERSNFGRGV